MHVKCLGQCLEQSKHLINVTYYCNFHGFDGGVGEKMSTIFSLTKNTVINLLQHRTSHYTTASGRHAALRSVSSLDFPGVTN